MKEKTDVSIFGIITISEETSKKHSFAEIKKQQFLVQEQKVTINYGMILAIM